MIRPILLYGHPVLREKGSPILEVTEDLRAFAEDLIETMRDAEGVGLAAQQVGSTQKIAVVDVSGAENPLTFLRVNGEECDWEELMPFVFLNPRVEGTGDRVKEQEGCLSFPDVRGDVPRPESIKAFVETMDGEKLEIETDGLFARAIQHETDHLNGILFIDRMSSGQKLSVRTLVKAIQRDGLRMAKG
ncbi:MAG: peptide deformylase [Verrucomicrobiota bacterium]